MNSNDHIIFNGIDKELKEGMDQIKQYLETHIRNLNIEVLKKDNEITQLKETLEKTKQHIDGNTQLINKLLGELSTLQNDVDWYKRTYEKRSLLGTLREKLFRK